MIVCARCGHQNAESARFCSSCGAPLPDTGDATQSIAAVESEATIAEETAADLDELPDGIGAVIVDRGPNAGSRFLLEHTTTAAGRHPESEIFLDDVTVSRRHAMFERRPDGYVLRDVGSLNGTYANGDRVDEYQLRNGDEVQIGRYRLMFLVGGSG